MSKTKNGIKNMHPALSAVMASVVSVLVMLILFPRAESVNNESVSNKNNLSDKEIGGSQIANNTGEFIGKIVPDTVFIKDTIRKYITVTDYINKEPFERRIEKSDNSAPAENQELLQPQIRNIDRIRIKSAMNYSESKNLAVRTFDKLNDNSSLLAIRADDYNATNFEIETFANIDVHFSTIYALPGNNTQFNNKGLGLYYKLNDRVKIGGEIRRETFNQFFEDEEKYYWQQPSLTSYCGALKYYMADWQGISPYCKLAAGGNIAGYIIRPSLGIDYSPYFNLNLFMGFEYSYFNYYHNQVRFASHKGSFIYGVNYTL